MNTGIFKSVKDTSREVRNAHNLDRARRTSFENKMWSFFLLDQNLNLVKNESILNSNQVHSSSFWSKDLESWEYRSFRDILCIIRIISSNPFRQDTPDAIVDRCVAAVSKICPRKAPGRFSLRWIINDWESLSGRARRATATAAGSRGFEPHD